MGGFKLKIGFELSTAVISIGTYIILIINNNISIWYSATSIIVRGASQHITI